jgi:alpha-ketoglutarate-dependent taurine dioxygenase
MSAQWIMETQLDVPLLLASPQEIDNVKFLRDYIHEHNSEITQKLNHYGAILFRGFDCVHQDSFSKIIDACGLGERCSTADYDFPRTMLNHNIYTSSDLPEDVVVYLHHEKPRSKEPPHHIYFCCVIPPAAGGGTIFANAAAIWRDIPKSIQDKVIEYGVLYRQYFHRSCKKFTLLKKLLGQKGVRSWQEYYLTDDKKVVEEKLVRGEATWSWVNAEKDLILQMLLPGVVNHPITQEMLWFNSSAYLNFHVHKAPQGLKNFHKQLARRYITSKDVLSMVCHYGNGQSFAPQEISAIQEVLDLHSSVLTWQQGDFMIVDNFTFMHGKQPHKGERLLYSCMTKSMTYENPK